MRLFRKLWALEIAHYDRTYGLNLKKQAADSAHRKSAVGKEKTGTSTVDRRKFGTILSVIKESDGFVIGLGVVSSTNIILNYFMKQFDQFQNH